MGIGCFRTDTLKLEDPEKAQEDLDIAAELDPNLLERFESGLPPDLPDRPEP